MRGEINSAEFLKDLEAVNARFNEELQRQIDGTLPQGHVYKLGHPEEILLLAELEDLPIELSARRLAKKASPNYRNDHPFDLSNIMDLPKALNRPVAVFDDPDNAGNKNVLIDLQCNGVNFTVTIGVRKNKLGRELAVEVNDIITLFPRDRVDRIFGWFGSENGLLRWVDKEKARRFISTQPTDVTGGGNKGRAKTKALSKINDFQNPLINKETSGLLANPRLPEDVTNNPTLINKIQYFSEKVNTQSNFFSDNEKTGGFYDD